MLNHVEFSELIGKTITQWTQGDDEIRISCSDGTNYALLHEQDCYEQVCIESVTGDVADLTGEPLLIAEVSTSEDRPADVPAPEYPPESQTWTFYRLATRKGFVVIRWWGSSNGYYSESVSFVRLDAAP